MTSTTTTTSSSTEAEITTAESNGASFQKANRGFTVLSFILPRNLWDSAAQTTRTKRVNNLRCGPHLTILDPFVQESDFLKAEKILLPILNEIPPFQITFDGFDYFKHGKNSFTLYVKPIPTFTNASSALAAKPVKQKKGVPHFNMTDPLQYLVSKLLSAFPQCDDTIKKSNRFIAHMSIGRYSTREELLADVKELKATFQPFSVTCKELCMIHRTDVYPYEVKRVVALGNPAVHCTPWYGDLSVTAEEETTALARTVVFYNIAKTITKEQEWLAVLESEAGVAPAVIEKTELCLNPDWKPRGIVLVQFHTRKDALQLVHDWKHLVQSRIGLTGIHATPLSNMTYPSIIGSTTSVQSVIPQP